MESAAREMNLNDLAERVQKIIEEAIHFNQRLEQAGDTLRGGGRDTNPTGANAPQPSGLVPLIGHRLGILEALQSEQRQLMNRLQDGLTEAPPPAPIKGALLTGYQGEAIAVNRRY